MVNFLLPASLVLASWTTWLEPTGTALIAIALVLLCALSWATNLIALPGNWIAVALLALYVWLGPEAGRAAVGLPVLLAAFLLAVVGEVFEFLAGAVGAQRAGASRRSTVYALVGSIVGAITGAVVGLPVPVIGSLLAAILFGGLGATAGAMYGESRGGKPWKESLSIGHAAFWGRTLGTVGKASVGLIIVLVAAAGVAL